MTVSFIMKVIIGILCFLGIALFIIKKKIRKDHPSLTIGEQAPDFTLLDDQGNPWRLYDHLGNKLVIYFYPKDSTPGCTAEACSLRDNSSLYGQKNIKVVGISYDTVDAHRRFKEKYHLPFTLLSDNNKEVAKRYGAYRSILSIFSPARITYLLNEQGIIIHLFEKVDIKNQAQQIIHIFDEYNSGIKNKL